MIFDADNQAIIFLGALVLGGMLGLCYDFFRVLRVAIPSGAKLVFWEDILFFIIATAVLFFFFLGINNGEIHPAYLLGVFLGWVLYYFTFGVLVMSVSTLIVNLLKKLVFYPIYRVLCGVKKLVIVFCKFFCKFFGKFLPKNDV